MIFTYKPVSYIRKLEHADQLISGYVYRLLKPESTYEGIAIYVRRNLANMKKIRYLNVDIETIGDGAFPEGQFYYPTPIPLDYE